MTSSEFLTKIKAEIEKLKKAQEVSEDKDYAQYELDVACGYDMACNDILSFLSTLESEKPMNQEGLEEEISRYLREECSNDDEPSISDTARHFAQWQKEQDDKLVDIIYQQGIEKGKDDMREQMIKEFETWLKGNLHHLSCWNADEFYTNLKCYLGIKNEQGR